jgi:hypothetical protein
MKLQELKIGDKIQHFCFGNLIDAEVIETDGRGVTTRHEPIQWGRDTWTESYVMPSTYLQKKWGGTDEHGQPCKGAETTPASFYKGNPIESPLTN